MKPVVLLIDSNAVQARVLASTLIRAGHAVLRVETIIEAARLLRVRRINVVVFRDQYDDVDGFSVSELLRLFNLPSIALTSNPVSGPCAADFSVEDSPDAVLEAIHKIEANA